MLMMDLGDRCCIQIFGSYKSALRLLRTSKIVIFLLVYICLHIRGANKFHLPDPAYVHDNVVQRPGTSSEKRFLFNKTVT